MPLSLVLWAALLGCPKAADRELVHQLDREILALRERNEALKTQLQSCSAGELDTELYAQLNQVFSGTEVQVGRAGVRAVVTIPGELLFAPGSVEVREEARMVLDLLGIALRLHGDTHVWVVAHTDDEALSGALKRRFLDNWGLSTARSRAIMLKLSEDFGVEAERFTIAGRGSSEPVAENDTPEGRAKNRRVVVVIGAPDATR